MHVEVPGQDMSSNWHERVLCSHTSIFESMSTVGFSCISEMSVGELNPGGTHAREVQGRQAGSQYILEGEH